MISSNTADLVRMIRKTSQIGIDVLPDGLYRQPPINTQTIIIDKLLKDGIKIDIVNAPVFLLEDDSVGMMKSYKIYDNKFTPDATTKQIFILAWYMMNDSISIIRCCMVDRIIKEKREDNDTPLTDDK